MLGKIDQAASAREGQHLQSSIPAALAYGGPGCFGFHPDAYMDEDHPLAIEATAEEMTAAWAPHWSRSEDVWDSGHRRNHRHQHT